MKKEPLTIEEILVRTDNWFQRAHASAAKRGQYPQIIRTRAHGSFLNLVKQHVYEIGRTAIYSHGTHGREIPVTMKGFTELTGKEPTGCEPYRICYLKGRWFNFVPGFTTQDGINYPPSFVSECWLEKLSKKEIHD